MTRINTINVTSPSVHHYDGDSRLGQLSWFWTLGIMCMEDKLKLFWYRSV